MNQDITDRIFRERLGQGTASVPEGLWENVEQKLPVFRHRRTWIGWWFAISFGVMVSGIAIFFNSGVPTTQTNEFQPGSPQTESLATHKHNTTILPPADAPASERTEQQNSNDAAVVPASQPVLRSSVSSGNTLAMTSTHHSGQTTASAVSERAVVSGDALLLKRDFITVQRLSPGPEFLVHRRRHLPDPEKDCYDFGRRGNWARGVLFAEVYAGPVLANHRMASRSEDVSAYIHLRDSTESARLSWHAGLRLGYRHSSGATLRIGGHYTMVNEVFDYFDGSFSQTVTRIDSIFDAGGNLIRTDTIRVVQTGQRIKKTYNRYHMIDLPLLAGYEGRYGIWHYGVHAGPVFNVAFIKKGDILSPAGDPVSISDSDPAAYPAFADRLGLSIYGAALLGRRIGEHTYLYSEIYIHHRLRSMTMDTYPIDQRQTNAGLSVGLRMKFQ